MTLAGGARDLIDGCCRGQAVRDEHLRVHAAEPTDEELSPLRGLGSPRGP
jgi:hypothetical protein